MRKRFRSFWIGQRIRESCISLPSQTISEREQEVFSARPVAAVLPKPATDKSMREKRTTRIDPGVYDAVERELKRQKRSRKRASSTLSDLLDELLRGQLLARSRL